MVFSEIRQPDHPPPKRDFVLYNNPTKAKVSLAFVGLLYEPILAISRRLVPAMGGCFALPAAAGLATSGLPACHCGISPLLQAIPPAGDRGFRTAIYRGRVLLVAALALPVTTVGRASSATP